MKIFQIIDHLWEKYKNNQQNIIINFKEYNEEKIENNHKANINFNKCNKITLIYQIKNKQNSITAMRMGSDIKIFIYCPKIENKKTFFINVYSVLIHEYCHILLKKNKKLKIINFDFEELICITYQFYYESLIRNVNFFKIINHYLKKFNETERKIYFNLIKNIFIRLRIQNHLEE
jgi:hypothetical protein